MRYGKDQKQATRQHIIEAAGRRFKQDGIDGAGVAAVMSGCPSAALLDEIARRPAATRQIFTDELMGVIDDIAARLDPTDAEAARTDALTLFGTMIGTLQLARTLTDRDLSDQLLARGVETAMKLLDDRP